MFVFLQALEYSIFYIFIHKLMKTVANIYLGSFLFHQADELLNIFLSAEFSKNWVPLFVMAKSQKEKESSFYYILNRPTRSPGCYKGYFFNEHFFCESCESSFEK